MATPSLTPQILTQYCPELTTTAALELAYEYIDMVETNVTNSSRTIVEQTYPKLTTYIRATLNRGVTIPRSKNS